MTESEAIKELHEIRPRGGIIPQKRAEAIDVAINALEKQIPKKPKTDDRYVMYICPCCNDFIKVSHNCCQNCGQKIKFNEPPKVKMIEIAIKAGGISDNY